MENWELLENPSDETYQQLIKVLCDNSDKFYFITRQELSYNPTILLKFKPYILQSYKTNKWANTITKGPRATVYVIEANSNTCRLLQQSANKLYDWVSPELPEDLTFIKNNFEWFSCTSHEEFGGFSIRSDQYRDLMNQIEGLKIKKVE
jgi:hypothetical protein